MNSTQSRESALHKNLSAKAVLQSLPLILLVGFYLYHLWVIYRLAVDVPFWDEWENLIKFPAASWMLSPHNEHFIVPTKVLNYLLWLVDGDSYRTQQILNFPIFGCVVACLGVLIQAGKRSIPLWLIALLLLFCLSPLNVDNHTWGFQSQWHFTLLFLFGCIYFWFAPVDKTSSNRRWILGTLCGVLCTYSMSSGIPAMVILVLLLGGQKSLRVRGDGSRRVLEWRHFMLAAIPVMFGVGHYFWTFRSIRRGNPATFPWEMSFWNHFLAMISNAGGIVFEDPYSQIAGLGFLVFVFVPWGIFAWRSRKGLPVPNLWYPGAALLGVLGALLSISVGRASLGVDQAFAYRYREFTMMLLPLSFVAWWYVLENKPRLRGGFVVIFLAAYNVLFLTSLRYFPHYERVSASRVQGLQKVRLCYYSGQSECSVPPLYSFPIRREWLNRARELNYSFFKQIQ